MRKDCMARELTVEVVVGVFVVMVLLGLGLFTIILSGNSLRKSQYPVQVLFSSVMGLRDGDSIVVRGMPVGKVEDLELTAEGVLVEGRIVEKLDMRRDYRVTIVQTSVLGGRYLQIHEGSPEAPPLPAGIVLKGEEPYDLMEDAAELVSRLREAFVNGGVIADLEASASALRAVISRVHAGEGTVGRLLADEGALYSDLADAVSSLKVVSGRLESGNAGQASV
jgi:phospholipid/cholesterol/gamma-HCH transport system substrate-binding protein